MGTTAKGYPYPEGTDLVMDGDDAIQALAEAINARAAYGLTAGTALSTGIAAGTAKSVTKTLPAGRFTARPQVTATIVGTAPQSWACTVSARSTSSVTFVIYNGAASASRDGTVDWQAMQFSAATLLAAEVDDEVPVETVTCPTVGCDNYGIPIDVPSAWIDDDGVAHPIDDVSCGVCDTNLNATIEPIEDGS